MIIRNFIKLFTLLTYIYAIEPTIFFVYNAKNDFPSIVGDFFHKSLAPKTYPCQLCKLTYGTFSKKKQWEEYLSSLKYNYQFVYKNDIKKLTYIDNQYPVILFGQENKWDILVSKEELNNCQTIEKLIDKITLKLKN